MRPGFGQGLSGFGRVRSGGSSVETGPAILRRDRATAAAPRHCETAELPWTHAGNVGRRWERMTTGAVCATSCTDLPYRALLRIPRATGRGKRRGLWPTCRSGIGRRDHATRSPECDGLHRGAGCRNHLERGSRRSGLSPKSPMLRSRQTDCSQEEQPFDYCSEHVAEWYVLVCPRVPSRFRELVQVTSVVSPLPEPAEPRGSIPALAERRNRCRSRG